MEKVSRTMCNDQNLITVLVIRPEACCTRKHCANAVMPLPGWQGGLYSRGWTLAHPEFGSSVNPIPTRGAVYAHHITYCLPTRISKPSGISAESPVAFVSGIPVG